MNKLVREQRKLSRKQKNSNNRNKQRQKLAIVHEKVTNCRKDFLHKQSSILVNENQVICIEDLDVKRMMHKNRYAKNIASASWGMFASMLTYKCEWYGRSIVKVPTNYPSSQTCSVCGYKNPVVKNVRIRKWECPACHTVHDRDKNASVNILAKGLDMLAI